MRDFWSENSKTIGKNLLNQFGGAFFGIMLFFAAYALRKFDTLPFISSIISVTFYLYLLYLVMWERGGQDRIKYDGGRAEKKPLTGLWISLLSNVPNLILAALILISEPFIKGSPNIAGGINTVSRAIAILWEGMYMGVIRTFAPHNPLIYLLMVFPAVFVGAYAYLVGFNNRRLFGLAEVKKK
ncbi:MAG: hypothetical protein E7628_06690 [Ruminococcaceae bacterium]|nr:hypothetical protein [Oscillospiraceae bacterium]